MWGIYLCMCRFWPSSVMLPPPPPPPKKLNAKASMLNALTKDPKFLKAKKNLG